MSSSTEENKKNLETVFKSCAYYDVCYPHPSGWIETRTRNMMLAMSMQVQGAASNFTSWLSYQKLFINEWMERNTRSVLWSSKWFQNLKQLLALQFSPQFCTSKFSFLSSDHLRSLLVVCPKIKGCLLVVLMLWRF